jgi:hypothetical protein
VKEMNCPRSKLWGIARHAGLDPASRSVLDCGFRRNDDTRQAAGNEPVAIQF